MGEGCCPQVTIEVVIVDFVTDMKHRNVVVREMKDTIAVETDLERGNTSVRSTPFPTKLGQDRHNLVLR